MSEKTAKDLINRLTNLGDVKVWSLLVTVFGDMAEQDGGTISGAQLNALFTAMNIKPEALRVALHRLRKEGWIQSEKTGRTSKYCLSESGLMETRRVWKLIYEGDNGPHQDWHLVVFPKPREIVSEGAVKVSPSSYLLNGTDAGARSDGLVVGISHASIPTWLETKILPETGIELVKNLSQAAKIYRSAAPIGSSVQQAALRTLFVHSWRRIALRDASWLHMKLYKDGIVRNCHDSVHAVLEQTPRTWW